MEFVGNKDNRISWSKHFIQVKSKIKQPKRTHSVNISTRTGKNYSYKYADLADVDKAVTDACSEVKDKDGNVAFGYFFDIENGPDGVTVQTIMVDISGCAVKSNKVWFKNSYVGDAQQTAGLISYAKRYSLSAAFGVASEEDDDVQNLKPSNNRSRARTLNKNELEHYQVECNGVKYLLIDIWNDYLKNKDPFILHQLMSQNNPQTSKAIRQLVNHYNLTNKIENAKKKKAKQAVANKAEVVDKSADDAETINQLVDGKNDNDINTKASDANVESLNLF